MCQTSPETNGVFSPAVFAGSHRRTLDPKKRLTGPSSWRNAIGEGGVIFVLPDPRGCLKILTQEEMAAKIQRFKNKALLKQAVTHSSITRNVAKNYDGFLGKKLSKEEMMVG